MGRPTALVVEDEWLLLDVMEAELTEEGFDVITATSGREALSKLEVGAWEISCLLTDIRLGNGANGWKVAERARELNSEVPVIYMTGDSHAQWQANGVARSILLSKPFALSQLTAAVSELVKTTRATAT
ncbi:MAG TPA: response regulator [Devosia sp.]|jgi:DNA-binding response OmpR family regulator